MSRGLEVRDLTVGYTALDVLQAVDLQVCRHEIVCIIGPNGAGKSTLARTVFGLLKPRRGRINFQDGNLVGLKPSEIVKRGLCYVPQERNVFANLTVRENLELGGFLLGRGLRDAIARVLDLFPDLKERHGQRAGTLSGGQRQMLAMGRALMLEPCLLILDEPSAGLAPNMVATVFEKILEINAAGCAVLMVEQNARQALAMSHRGYVLDMGRNAMEGPGAALLEDPRVIRLYLGGLEKQ